MEKHLGWIVGGVSAVLLGSMTPLIAFASPDQSQSSQTTTSTTSTTSAYPTTSTTNTQTTNTTASGNASSQTALQSTTVQPTLPEKIQYVDQVATNAVHGGTVTNIIVDNSGTRPVWLLTVQQPGASYQVTVSVDNYSVLATTPLN